MLHYNSIIENMNLETKFCFIQVFICEIEKIQVAAKSVHVENIGSLTLVKHTIFLTSRTCSILTKLFHKRETFVFGYSRTKVAIGKGEVHLSINKTRSVNIPIIHWDISFTLCLPACLIRCPPCGSSPSQNPFLLPSL